MPSVIEIERKYDVGEEHALPVPAGFTAGPDSVAELDAVYWDTADAALAQAAIALRRREGGHDAGWHLKTPAELGREELTAALSDAPPAEILARIAPVVGDAPLAELARLRTRRVIRVLEEDGRAVVELADDRVIATDARAGTERRWREWEAELLPGAVPDGDRAAADALLDRVESALVAAGAAPSRSRSKLARALGRDALG